MFGIDVIAKTKFTRLAWLPENKYAHVWKLIRLIIKQIKLLNNYKSEERFFYSFSHCTQFSHCMRFLLQTKISKKRDLTQTEKSKMIKCP